MKKILAIGVCALALAACGGAKTEAPDTEAMMTEPEVTTPEVTAPAVTTPQVSASAEAFKAACLITAAKEDEIDSSEEICTCATARLSEVLRDGDLAIAAKAMTYDNPSDAREALSGETDNLREIVDNIGDALEACD